MPYQPHHYNVYADETCQNAHRYMVIGGVVCRPDFAAYITREIDDIKASFSKPGVVKWNLVKVSKLKRYKAIVDCFFDHNAEHRIDFSAIVIDTSKLNHRKFNAGIADVGFNKFVYQHLVKHTRKYEKCSYFMGILDHRDTPTPLEDLRSIVNGGCAKHHRDFAHRYKTLHFRFCKDENLLQVSDLLIGAIGHCLNGKDDTSRNPAKPELADYIRQKACVKSLALRTYYARKHFDIWHFKGQDWG